MKRVAVLVSGRGSNLQALIDAERRGELGPATIALVIANRTCIGQSRAADAGIPCELVRLRDYESREDWNDALLATLREASIDLVVTAGFDRVLGQQVLDAYPQAILNVHPALLPSFPGGLHAQADAIAYGVKISGCTVHFSTNEVDAGPIVLQRAVEVWDDDDEASLAARILAEEHRALPQAVRLAAEGRLRVEGRRVRVLAPASV
jgi:phosphoribosylglycinamide formyltransferase-1